MRAAGAGQQFGRTARIQVLAKQPWSPVIGGRRPIGVLVMQGTRGLGQLAARLGPQFSVTSTLTSSVFSAADPARTKTSAVVVDLDLVPVTVVAELHAVLPELQIVGLTNNAQTAAIDRKAGATIVIAKPASVYAVSEALKRLLRTSK
jgi:ActR/RegA family two-component response regulator